MGKVWTVGVREYLATVRTKAFVISVVLMPVMMSLGGVVGYFTRRLEDRTTKTFVVIDRTPKQVMLPRLQEANEFREKRLVSEKTGERTTLGFTLEPAAPGPDTPEAKEQQRLDLSDRVRKGEIVGFLEIGPRAGDRSVEMLGQLLGGKPKKAASDTEWANDPAAIRYQSKPTATGAREFLQWVQLEASLAQAGVKRSQADPESYRPPVVSLGLTVRDRQTGKAADDKGMAATVGPTITAMSLFMLMFMVIFVGCMPLMQSVLEEKLQKIADVLLGAVTPFQLMLGKLLGGLGTALTLAVIYVGGAYAVLVYYGMQHHVPPSLLAWFVFYLVFGLLMNGAMYLAVGAACNDMKDPQTLMLPVMLPLVVPMSFAGLLVSQPDGAVVRGISYFPFTTPMFMIARQAMGSSVGWWEPPLAALVMVVAALGCVWAAGRIFRVGLLMQGKTPKFTEMLGWVVRGA